MRKVKEKKSKYGYLAENIALFSVSNFVSKILVFLLVPLYTDVLTTAEYGIADIMQVTLLLLVPALTLNMGEAALRFGIEKTDKRGSILRCGLGFILRADLLVCCLALISPLFVSESVKWYVYLFVFLFAANSLFEFLVLYFQGCEMVPVVVIGSVSSTVIMIVSNILFLLVFKIGLNGYIFSQIIAFALASIIMLILGKMGVEEIKFEKDEELNKEMVSYGIPMIAYSTGSWINNASDRYIVAALCGAAVNGVYGVAYKIPAILTVFQRIFAQAWQMSATKSYGEDRSEEFFSNMYKVYNTFMVLGCSVLVIMVRIIAKFMFRKEFYDAWQFVPFLLISVIFGALTGFLGSICLAHKDSKSMGIATLCGAVINIILNLLLVPFYGAMGAAFATAVSYAIMCIMAFVFVRKHVTLNVNIKKDMVGYLLLVAEAVVMIWQVGHYYLFSLILVLLIAALYFKDIMTLAGSFWNMLMNRKGKADSSKNCL